jgi:SAM-dependent methyltransferase
MPEFDEAFWDNVYRSRDAAWSGEPNDRIVAAVAGAEPGYALEVGCGDGADAIWLAQHGWNVTAVDISAVALERARAMDATGRVEWRRADLLEWEPRASAYDLVAAHFVHFAAAERAIVFPRLAAAVRSGGVLLVVSHHPSDLETTARRCPMPEYFYTADDVAALLEPGVWDVETTTDAREIPDRNGDPVTVHDSVLRARRRPAS